MEMIDASRLVSLRRTRGLSQRAVAEAAHITRQTVGAIESGRMQPSVGIALALARALDATVEELFAARQSAEPKPERVVSATIGGKRVRHALSNDQLAIEPAEASLPNVFVAGCDLAVGLLSRHATTRSRSVRVLWLPMTNRAALKALAERQLHAAVIHGDVSPEETPRGASFLRYEIAKTEAGWLLARGNPLHLRGARDLPLSKARLANRPAGSGARRLLDQQLRRDGVDPRRVIGYGRELSGQLDAGRAIAQDFADTAVGMASVARIFELQLLPLRKERCTLLVPRAAIRTMEIRALLDALRSSPYRRDLEALQAYDVTMTGEEIA